MPVSRELKDCAAEGGCDPTPPTPPVAHRRVHPRRVVGEATEAHDLVVQCPVRGGTALDECRACPYLQSVTLDASGHGTTTCELHAPERPTRAPAGEPLAHAHVRVRSIASDPTCVRPDVSLARLAALFTDASIGGAPVVDDAKRPIGFVSRADLVRDPRATSASSIMTREVHTLPEHASIAEAAELMSKHGIHHVVIVAGDGSVTGVVSTFDVTRWLAHEKTPRDLGNAGYQLRPH